jgi:hypothetical protein
MARQSVKAHSTRLPPSVARGAAILDTDPPMFRIPAAATTDSSRQNAQSQSQKLSEILSCYSDITDQMSNAPQLAAAAGPVNRDLGGSVSQRANAATTRISASPQVDTIHQIAQSQGQTRLQGDLTFK